MKTHITENIFSSNNKFLKPLELCREKLKSFLSQLRLESLPDYSLTTVLSRVAAPAVAVGLVAFQEHALNNVRNLVGNILLVVGFAVVFLHQIFSHEPTPLEVDTTWYYVHVYYFLLDIRFPLALIFLSASFMLLSPAKWKYAAVPFSVAHSLGWMFIIQRIMFLNVTGLDIKDQSRWQELNQAYNSIPSWGIIVVALALGTSIMLSLDQLIFRYTHTIRGNHTRLVGVAEMNAPAEQKELLGKQLAKEFRNLNARV